MVRTPCRCIGVYVDGFPRIACEFTQHSQVSCDRGSGRQNRQKVSRLGVLGALWQAKIVKKCHKDTAFSSKITSFHRKSKFAYLRRKCTSLKRNVRILGSGPSKMRLFDVGECFGRRWGLQGAKKEPFWSPISPDTGFAVSKMEPKRRQNGAQNHPNIVKNSHLISDVFFIAFGHQKSAKRTPLLAPKSNLFNEHQNLLICDDHAPRLSGTYEFEVQGPRK